MNIAAVAKHAKVSTATVSRTVNGSSAVSPKMAARVNKSIKELGYIPNSHARTLRSGESTLYGLIVSDVTNPYFPELIFNFERIAVEHNVEILLANTNYDSARMESVIFRFMARRVDGIAIMTSEINQHLIRKLVDCNVPLVFLNQEISSKKFSNIRVEYTEGFNQAVGHLMGLGHRDIGFIAGPVNLSSANRRREALLTCMRQNRLAIVDAWHVTGDHQMEGGYRAMRSILQQKKLPTAVIASNDLMAIGAMNAIQDHGLRIPQDMSVVGFDDISICLMMRPQLTTMRVSREEIATRAFFSLFMATTQRPRVPHPDTAISPQLVIRQTTDVAPSSKAIQSLEKKSARFGTL
jgi:DNA-binding LacI/PurR family transcriptional regulator